MVDFGDVYVTPHTAALAAEVIPTPICVFCLMRKVKLLHKEPSSAGLRLLKQAGLFYWLHSQKLLCRLDVRSHSGFWREEEGFDTRHLTALYAACFQPFASLWTQSI